MEDRVAARTSSFSFGASPTNVGDIGRKLNVAAVLEGTSRPSGDTIRVTTNLIDTRTGFAIWSHAYDRPAGDMLHLETDIATDIAAALKITLLDGDVTRMRIGSTNNPQALDAYLRGITLKHKMDPANAHVALAAFDQAIALDPNFAWAHVLRAKMLTGMAEGFPPERSRRNPLPRRTTAHQQIPGRLPRRPHRARPPRPRRRPTRLRRRRGLEKALLPGHRRPPARPATRRRGGTCRRAQQNGRQRRLPIRRYLRPMGPAR